MTDAERNAVGVALAGKNQYRVLASIMTNFEHAVGATEDALHSEGTALQQNAAYMESIEAKTTNLKAKFQDLSQNVVNSDAIKGVLNLAGGFLDILNTDIGTVITQFTLLSGVITGIAGMAIKGFGLSIGLTTILPYIAIAVGAFVGLYNIIKLVKDTIQEKEDAKIFDNINSKIEESSKKIEDYDKKIQESNNKLKELNDIPFADRTPEIEAEIAKLEALIASYETLKKEEERALATDYLEQLMGTEYEDGVKITPNYYGGGAISEKFLNQPQIIEALNKEYKSYEEAVYGVSKAVASVDTAFAKYLAEGHSVEELTQKLSDYYIDISKTTHDFNTELLRSSSSMKGYIADLNDSETPSAKLLSNTDNLIKKNKEYYEALTTIQKAGGPLNKQALDFISTYQKLYEEYEKATIGADAYNNAISAISKLDAANRIEGETTSLEEYVRTLNNIEGIDVSNIGSLLTLFQELGYVNLDYTDEQLQAILDKIGNLDGSKAEIDVEADTDGVIEQVLSAEEELESRGIKITSSSDASALLESIKLIEAEAQKISSNPVKISIETNASSVLKNIRDVTNAINAIPKNVGVNIKINVYGLDAVQSAANAISSIYDKTATITITVRYVDANGNPTSAPSYATGKDYFGGGYALINDGAPVNGSAAELVIADGEAKIYNNGEPIVAKLPKGAKIYTAAETQEILKNKDILNNAQSVPSFAEGNVTKPSDINAENIEYIPSEYYKQDVESIKNSKDAFEKWQKTKKHLLELDLITEEQYYLDLEYMNETYLQNIKGAEDDYWRYQEEIYKWKKSQLADENKLLEQQIELEKALQDV